MRWGTARAQFIHCLQVMGYSTCLAGLICMLVDSEIDSAINCAPRDEATGTFGVWTSNLCGKGVTYYVLQRWMKLPHS